MPTNSNPITWAYGVTTVPSRKEELLPRTLASLKKGGFDKPRLFVDGLKDPSEYDCFGLEVTARFPGIRIVGNWILSLWELYLREPQADRYAIFQDDFVMYKNLRQYLESCEYPTKGYWNLNTFPKNEQLAAGREGWYPSDQRGKSAIALVFSRDVMMLLLGREHLIKKPQDQRRGWKSIDGAISESFRTTDVCEQVHMPSLVQHTGQKSTFGNTNPFSKTFKGEDFDAMELQK